MGMSLGCSTRFCLAEGSARRGLSSSGEGKGGRGAEGSEGAATAEGLPGVGGSSNRWNGVVRPERICVRVEFVQTVQVERVPVDEGVTRGPEWANHGDMDDRLKQQLVVGREHYQKREFDKAEPLLREVVEQQDGFADVHNMLGVIAHERGDFATAEKHLERATELNPNYTEAMLNLAVTYNDQGKYEAGRSIYRRIRSARERSADNLDPFVKGKIANMHAELAQAYEDTGLRADAIRELERAVSMCPTFADLQTRLGTLHRDSGDLQKARKHYEAARDANPRYPLARLMLGVTLLALNDVEAAKIEWKAVLEYDPGNKSASMYLRMAENIPSPTMPPPESPPEPSPES